MSQSTQALEHIDWFRKAAPYINRHRSNTFVILFSGDAVDSSGFESMIHDFALLKSLGIKLVLVHGARPQIDTDLQEAGIPSHFVDNMRVTSKEALRCVMDAVGSTRLKIEALFSMGMPGSPMQHAKIDTVSGNFVIAKPYGVRNGVDFGHTGAVRSIDTEAIKKCLGNNQLVLMGPTGYSTTGEVYNLLTEQVAVKTAIALQADKLIFMGSEAFIGQGNPRELREMTPQSARRVLDESQDLSLEMKRHLLGSVKACEQGVNRAHIVSYLDSGALIKELFTIEGAGTLVSMDEFEDIEHADLSDLPLIQALLEPLEKKGVLVPRSRQVLEAQLEHFYVIRRDSLVVGCAALLPLSPLVAEVASIAVHPSYREGGRGERLIRFLEQQAKLKGHESVVALTTQTAHWFIDQGFVEVSASELPESKKQQYNASRSSKVYQKHLG